MTLLQSNLVLSIVVATRNMGKFLAECLGSVFCQELPRECFEVIVVDDASSDETYAVVQEFASRFGNVAYFKNPEQLGQAASKNVGVTMARGEWLFMLDADNSLHDPFVLSTLLRVGNENSDTGFVYGDRVCFDATRSWVVNSAPVGQHLFDFNYIDGNFLVRKKALGLYDVKCVKFTDWERVLDMVLNNWEGVYLSMPLIRYRFHENNTGTVNASRNSEMVEYIKGKYAERIARYGT